MDNSTSNNNAPLSSQFASLSSMHHHQNKQTSSSSSSSRRTGGDWYGISGPFLVRQAFQDLSKKCNGRVVFVSVAGTSGILDLDLDINSSSDDDHGNNDAIQLFRQNGAVVDLNSNPFGWNDENEDENNCCINSFSIKATLNNLLLIAIAIRQAASHIDSSEQQSSQQPIPIIFDTLTPLLHLHGAERITILLKSLGRTTAPLDNSNNTSSSILSPIIAPVLYESICLSDHRTLEDCADAMVSLNLMDTATTATNHVVEAKDDNSVVVVSGVMNLVRRGGGGGNVGLGGKLMRHCVPVHILRSLSTTTGDLKDGCYWIIDSGDNDNTDCNAAERGKKQTRSTNSSISEMGQSQLTDTNSSRPKIYLEDDDPDYQDYDEDDDLDL